MEVTSLAKAVAAVSETMQEKKNYLVKLDQKFGDGDLGLSMAGGFKAVSDYMSSCAVTDLGSALLKCSTVFNEAAPSSLGTIISMFFMGMAKELKGKRDASLEEVAHAMKVGADRIIVKTDSRPGQKTILDSLCPAVDALGEHSAEGWIAALKAASKAASVGCESTRMMRSVLGRAAYYGEKSIGSLDGGAVVGDLIFSSLYHFVEQGD